MDWLVEELMRKYGWEAIWFPDATYPGPRAPRRFYVGTWTGPDGDLLCVRPCETKEEAETALSPPGASVRDAALRAAALRVRLDVAHMTKRR